MVMVAFEGKVRKGTPPLRLLKGGNTRTVSVEKTGWEIGSETLENGLVNEFAVQLPSNPFWSICTQDLCCCLAEDESTVACSDILRPCRS